METPSPVFNQFLSPPKVLLIGGPDVEARIELMRALSNEFAVAAAGSLPHLRERFEQAGFDYYNYPLGRGPNPIRDVYTLIYLWRLCRRLRPQVVHTFDTKPGVWGRLAAWGARIPVVIGTLTGLGSLYADNNLSIRLVRTIYQPLQKLACHTSHLTIFYNRDDARQFITAGVVAEQKTKIIPGSGVSTALFTPAKIPETKRAALKNELGIQPHQVVITMIARVIRSKGVIEYMTAAQEIYEVCSNAHFLLIGAEDRESVDRLNSEELTQLKQTITWLGPRQDIPAILAVSDIFVLPSYREGMPRVLLEAASMGLPIITTNAPGCSEVIQEGVNGFSVPVRDSTALSQVILHLIEQPELRRRFGQASRQRAENLFDISVIANQTRSVYRQLLTGQTLISSREI